MENRMAEVAKMFDVELGERFKICDDNGTTSEYNYYFSDLGLMIEFEECSAFAGSTLIKLLKGGYSIKRKPCKPKDGDAYWSVDHNGEAWYAEFWSSPYHMNMRKLGNCYRTEKEAKADRDKWIKFYASDDILDV